MANLKELDTQINKIKEEPEEEEYVQPACENSYQLLMEGKMDVIVSNKEKDEHLNLSKLLRDLYGKIYAVESLANKK